MSDPEESQQRLMLEEKRDCQRMSKVGGPLLLPAELENRTAAGTLP